VVTIAAISDDRACCRSVKGAIKFSIVINTDNRVDYLARTLASLKYLKYDNFEVCVVAGPTEDGTREYLASLGPSIKLAYCDERNLSKSRNIGIALAAGDVVAFIDDDAIPEPEWLCELAEAYADDQVGAAGGLVYDHTGVSFQAQYVTVNRRGYPSDWSEPAPHLNFPFSPDVPHLLGTNCSFRRSALLHVGGFDEEYEYFLDETDVAFRINDAGYRIVQLPDAYVHHKYAPSHMRCEKKIVQNWYPLIKNRAYFGLRNGLFHHSEREIIEAARSDVRSWEKAVLQGASEGIYSDADVKRFYEQTNAAIADGCVKARDPRGLLSQATIASNRANFVKHPTLLPVSQRRTFCFVSQDYPPGQNGGIARYFSQLARSLAASGHHVHVLTKAKGRSSVDVEDGVWVHRVQIRNFPAPGVSPISPHAVPAHIWSYSQTMLAEVVAINQKRKVDLVYCPLWDCEPLAFVQDGQFRVMVALQTTMKFWLQSQPQRAQDPEWMGLYGNPIMTAERLILDRASHFHAISHAIADDIRRGYEIDLPPDKLFHAHLCMEDWAFETALAKTSEQTQLLFVGRLESRKGIDVLLAVAPRVLKKYPDAILNIVGDDTIPKADGSTYRSEFEKLKIPSSIRNRIIFHGRVEEEYLRQFYRECDVLVAPSRYESFGLIFLEALVFGKPVIACDAGGGPEVIKAKETGLLVKPGDEKSLEKALVRLLASSDLRAGMGKAARADYEARFTEKVLARQIERELHRLEEMVSKVDTVAPARRLALVA
jgi:glycogen synthase